MQLAYKYASLEIAHGFLRSLVQILSIVYGIIIYNMSVRGIVFHKS